MYALKINIADRLLYFFASYGILLPFFMTSETLIPVDLLSY